MKPSSDDEDSASAWRKSSRPVQEVSSVKKEQEKQTSPEKTGDTAVVTLERCCILSVICLNHPWLHVSVSPTQHKTPFETFI